MVYLHVLRKSARLGSVFSGDTSDCLLGHTNKLSFRSSGSSQVAGDELVDDYRNSINPDVELIHC